MFPGLKGISSSHMVYFYVYYLCGEDRIKHMQLKKELNLLEVFCITTGAMMSSGLFLLPGLAHARAGSAIIISYLLAALLAATGMLSQAELASAMPKAGGTYFYVTRSMGSATGTVYGLITFFALTLKSSFELIGMAAFTHLILDIDIRYIATAFCIVFVTINILGVKEAGKVQIFLVFTIMAALFIYAAWGFPNIKVRNFESFDPKNVTAILSTAGFVFVSYGGLLKIASLAEEVKDPGRVLPLGMILSLLVVVAFYSIVIFVTIGVLDAGVMDKTLTPISDGAAVFMGPTGGILLSIVAIMAFTSAANAGIMGASRYPLALGRDGLLPGIFGRINRRFRTPHYAILTTGIFMIGALFLSIDVIVKAASSVLILTYMFSCIANIIMRESRIQNYQPRFKAPLYPWIQIAGVGGFAFLLYEIGREALAISAALIIGGLAVYWFYGRIRVRREFALLHCIERITAKELTTRSLETELKEIIAERDDIIKDRFDRVIEDATILDIEKSINVDELFEIVSDEMTDNLHLKREVIFDLLKKREEDSSTVLSPGLAIPHIIIEGEHKFEMLIARCGKGISFSESADHVRAVFVLMGTADERNFHLRALSAIAQIVMNSNFDKKWMAARDKEALRDIILLGKRIR